MSLFRARTFYRSLLPVLWLTCVASAEKPFRFYEKEIQLPERGKVTCCAIGWGALEYAFLPPRGWRVKVAAGEKELSFQSSNYEASISIEAMAEVPVNGEKQGTNGFRQEVLRQFTDCHIKEEFPCYTGASPGQGFKVEWLAFDKYKMCSRVAFVPIPGATLKLVLSGQLAVLANYEPAFGTLLTSLHQTLPGEPNQ